VKILLGIMLLFSPSTFLPAQMFEQVYPIFEYAQLEEGTSWNGDTLFLCGYDQILLRSTDAGSTWENQMPDMRDWCFYDITATEDAIYLLAEPTVFRNNALPKGQLASLLRYDPCANSLDVIEVPRLQASDPNYPTTIHDLTSAAGSIFLLQGNYRDGLVLHHSSDQGQNWIDISLPDSLSGARSTVVCFDTEHVGLVVKRTGGTWGVLVSTNGGENWSIGLNQLSNTERYGLMWLSKNELLAIEHEGAVMYSSDGGDTWEERSYTPVAQFKDAVAVNSSRGFILGAFGELFRTDDAFRTFVDISHGARGQFLVQDGTDTLVIAGIGSDDIYTSHDGGASWDFVRRTEFLFRDLRMASETVGVALVENLIRGTHSYYQTIDGWKSMTEFMDESHASFPQSTNSCRIFPVGESLWYLVPPELPDQRSLVHRSTNSGQTWETILSADDLVGVPLDGGITVTDLSDTGYFGIILGHTLVVTSDRGDSWETAQLLSGSAFSLHMVLRSNASSWMISGDGIFGRDTLWRSSEGWDEWEAVLTDPDTVGAFSTFRRIQITPAGEIVVLAEFDSPLGYQYDWSYIYRSSDDGQTWDLYPTSMNMDWYISMNDGSGLLFLPHAHSSSSRTRGAALYRSEDGWKSNTREDVLYNNSGGGQIATAYNSIYVNSQNVILRNLTNGVNGIQEDLQHTLGFVIHTPFPHPIRTGIATTFRIQLPKAGKLLQISLHDVMGRRVKVLHEAVPSTDTQVISWTPASVQTGLYILRAQHGEHVTVRPVVIQ